MLPLILVLYSLMHTYEIPIATLCLDGNDYFSEKQNCTLSLYGLIISRIKWNFCTLNSRSQSKAIAAQRELMSVPWSRCQTRYCTSADHTMLSVFLAQEQSRDLTEYEMLDFLSLIEALRKHFGELLVAVEHVAAATWEA